jgi:hypothetical protein
MFGAVSIYSFIHLSVSAAHLQSRVLVRSARFFKNLVREKGKIKEKAESVIICSVPE